MKNGIEVVEKVNVEKQYGTYCVEIRAGYNERTGRFYQAWIDGVTCLGMGDTVEDAWKRANGKIWGMEYDKKTA